MSITIYNPYGKSIQLSPYESLQLELKLNVSPYGHLWKDIGDSLFEYSKTKKSCSIYITVFQYEFICQLNEQKNKL